MRLNSHYDGMDGGRWGEYGRMAMGRIWADGWGAMGRMDGGRGGEYGRMNAPYYSPLRAHPRQIAAVARFHRGVIDAIAYAGGVNEVLA